MTMDGAMNDPQDIYALRLGFVVRHPNDGNGRPVIYIDRARMTQSPNHYNRDSYLRVLWYMTHTLTNSGGEDEDKYQRGGYIVIINLANYDPVGNKEHGGDRVGAKKTFDIIRGTSAMRLKAFHSIFSSRQSTILKILYPSIRAMHGKYIRLHSVMHFHELDCSHHHPPCASQRLSAIENLYSEGLDAAPGAAITSVSELDDLDMDDVSETDGTNNITTTTSASSTSSTNHTTKLATAGQGLYNTTYLDATILCRKYHFHSKHLSSVIGGEQTIHHHLEWIERQRLFEEQRHGRSQIHLHESVL